MKSPYAPPLYGFRLNEAVRAVLVHTPSASRKVLDVFMYVHVTSDRVIATDGTTAAQVHVPTGIPEGVWVDIPADVASFDVQSVAVEGAGCRVHLATGETRVVESCVREYPPNIASIFDSFKPAPDGQGSSRFSLDMSRVDRLASRHFPYPNRTARSTHYVNFEPSLGGGRKPVRVTVAAFPEFTALFMPLGLDLEPFDHRRASL